MKASYEELEKRVDELEKLEQKYKLDAEKYTIIFNQSPDGIAVVSAEDATIIDFNDQLCNQLGYTREEFSGMRIPDIEVIESEAATKARIEYILKFGKDCFETKQLTKSGEIRDVLIIVQKIKIGNNYYLHTIFRDITEQKKIEESLRNEKELFKKLSAQVPGVIYQYRYHPDGRSYFQFASDNLYNIYEVNFDEVNEDASKVFSRIHPDDLENVSKSIMDSYETLKFWAVEYRVILPVRGEKWLGGVAKPEKLQDGSVLWHGYIADITERKQAEIELEKTKEQFALAVKGTNDGIWDWNIQTNELFLSPRWKEILGFEDHELTNTFDVFVKLLHKDDFNRVQDYINRYFQGEIDKYEIEFRMIHKDGNPRWILAKGEALRSPHGIPFRMAGSHSDITDRKKSEIALKKSEEKFRQITENMNEVFWLRSADNTQMLYISPSYEKIWGRTCESLYKNPQSFMETIYKADQSMVFNEFRKYQETHFFSLEYRIVRPDNEIRWIYAQTYPIYNNSKEITGHTGLAVDITKRKSIEQELIDSEERWKFAIDGSGDGLWDWDAETNKVFFSTQWKKMLGYYDDEISDTLEEWESRVHPEDLPKCYEELDRHFRGESKTYSNVQRMLCKDGTYKWILDRGLVVDWLENGNPKRVIGTHRDITSEKETEAEIKKLLDEISLANQELEANLYQKNSLIDSLEETKMQLEESNSEKDKFFSIIAHDLRSPFNGFIGLTKVMVEDIEDLSLREFHEFSKALYDSAENLYQLLENLLTWSSMKRGATNFRPEPFQLKESVDIAYNLQKVGIDKKNQKIEIDVSPEIYVYGDNQMVNTVLRNLLSNANKFTRKHGLIKISAREISEEIEINITDSGIGMPENILNNLFKLGEKTSRKGTDYESSSGLGLLLCKEFIEKNKGKIWVESKEEIGTTFYFTLPKFDID